MPQLMNIDNNSLLRILTNTEDPNRRFPGPQNAAQIKDRGDYAYDLMKNMQLQGGANYVPMNALADSIRGYMGGRYHEKNERATRNMNEQSGRALTRASFPNYGGETQPSLTEPVMAEGGGNAGAPTVRPAQQQDANSNIDALVKQAADKAGVNPAWLRTFVDIESSGNPKAKKDGSQYMGLLQVSKEEAAKYGARPDADLTDPVINLAIGAAKLKAESEAYKQKYQKDPTPEELYMIHQQGQGGFDSHTANPDLPAWQNMAQTAQGRRMGQRWAKQAIWGNTPHESQKEFKDVNNITSGKFMDMWGKRVRDRVQKFTPPEPGPTAPKLGSSPLNAGGGQGLSYDGDMARAQIGSEPPDELAFNRNAIGMPGNEVTGTNILAQSPEQVGNEVASQGGVTERAKNPMQPPAQTTTIPKNNMPVPRPPEGTIPINAGAPNTQDQFAGMSQTREPEAQIQQVADRGGMGDQNSGNIMDLPTNPTSQIRPNQLYDVLKDPNIDPQLKAQIMRKAEEQGQMQNIPVEGGKLYYNQRTGQQLYVPEPQFKTESIKGINTNVMMIKPKVNGPWQVYDMESGQQINTGGASEGGTRGGGTGSPTSNVIPAQSGSGANSPGASGPTGGGIERRAARARDIERQDVLSKDLATNQGKERNDYITEGKSADSAKIGLKKLRELESAPENADITTGNLAPAWNEVKKNLKAWMPESVGSKLFKEGPMSISDVYQSMATIVGATLARTTDPNPSVKQFEALVGSNPSITQTPAGRKALLAALIHDVDMRSEMGKVARDGSLSQEAYDARIQGIRKEYASKQIIPEALLSTMEGKDLKAMKNAKWLTDPSEYNDVKVGDMFFTPDGELRRRNR